MRHVTLRRRMFLADHFSSGGCVTAQRANAEFGSCPAEFGRRNLRCHSTSAGEVVGKEARLFAGVAL